MVRFQSLKRVGGQFNTNCAFPAFNAVRHTIWWKNLCFDQCRISYFRRRKKCRRALFSQRAGGSFGCVLQMWSVMYHVTHISHVTHVTHISWRCISWPLSVAAFSPPLGLFPRWHLYAVWSHLPPTLIAQKESQGEGRYGLWKSRKEMDRKIGGEAMEQICMSCMFKAMPACHRKTWHPKLSMSFHIFWPKLRDCWTLGLRTVS